MSKEFKSVSELGEGLGISKKEIEAALKERSLSKILTHLRVNEGLTQSGMAKKIKKSQSFVSKLENSTNDKIKFSELGEFLSPLGYEISINIGKPTTLADSILNTFSHLRSLIEKLKDNQRNDKKIMLGLANFENKLATDAINLTKLLIKSSKDKLDKLESPKAPSVHLEDDNELASENEESFA